MHAAALCGAGSVALVLSGCAGDADPRAGPGPLHGSPPLTTIDVPRELHDRTQAAAKGPGTLSITDECVSLVQADGTATTIVWVEGRVSFDEKTRTITFLDISDEQFVLRDGDRITLGGGGYSRDDAVFPFIHGPHESCPEPMWLTGVLSRGE